MEITKLTCPHHERYRGTTRPRCGCASCWIKYLSITKVDKNTTRIPTPSNRRRTTPKL